MSSQLIWELVKRNNAFISKNVNGTMWSKEGGNLYNKHSYKYSGLANSTKFVGVNEAEDGSVAITTASKKNRNKANATIVKKNARRTAHAAGAVAAGVRPDLKKAAQARASAVARGIRSRKAVVASS